MCSSQSHITLNDLDKRQILGQGTYGKCYLVLNKINNQLCVLKQIDIQGMSMQQKNDVIKQARILSMMDHPAIVKAMGHFETADQLNILMEYADNGDLSRAIKQAKNVHFSQGQILNWFTQICLAVKYIHDRKIIHRDIKCQNVFMTKDGFVKLGDFGIAKNLSKTLDKAKTVVGTPYYMSPQICENKDYTYKTDIWSLGVLLYEMCQLKLPFDGNSLPTLALNISRGEYPSITYHYSKELKALVKSLLQNNPLKRPNITKILENPLIAKRAARYGPKVVLTNDLSSSQLCSKSGLQKQNDQDVFEESLKKSEDEKKIQVHSARTHQMNVKSVKSPQNKNSQIANKIKDFMNNSKPIKMTDKEKKKKPQSLKRRQISEPNLALKKFDVAKQNPIQLVKQEQNEQKQEFTQNIEFILRNIIHERHKKNADQKINMISQGGGLAGDSFCGNGIVCLLWGLKNMNLKNGF